MNTHILIGGIGSGKSTAAGLLAGLGVGCVDLDALGHEVLEDAQIREQLAEAFGGGVLDEQGGVIRAEVAARAFATQEGARLLSDITHPAIIARLRQRLAKLEDEGSPVAIVEASAYTGPQSEAAALLGPVAGIIAVVADEEVRLARAVSSGFAEEDARARMAAQPTDEQRRQWADYVIDNTGTLADLKAQVEALWEDLLGACEPNQDAAEADGRKD